METTSNSLTRYQVCGTACCNPPLIRNKSKKAREEPTQAKQSELTTGKISSDIYLKEKRSIRVLPVVNSSFFFRRNTGDQNVSTNPLPTDEDNVPAPSGGDSQRPECNANNLYSLEVTNR